MDQATHNLIVHGQSKRPEEREFYLPMAVQEMWSSRELERQFRLGAFERVALSPPKRSAVLRELHPAAANQFNDAYMVEFLNLPDEHSEADLHQNPGEHFTPQETIRLRVGRVLLSDTRLAGGDGAARTVDHCGLFSEET